MINSHRWLGKLLFGLAAAGLMVCASGAPTHAQSKMELFGGYS